MEMLREQSKQLQLVEVAKVNATACSQTGCSGLAPAPELFPSGSGCRNLALRAFMNKPYPFLSSYLISLLLNLTHITAKPKQQQKNKERSLPTNGEL